jgi:hypothetical protein
MTTKKYINIHDDVLIEWNYKNGYISENYSVWTNLKNQKRNFVSTSNNNKINYTLFNVDSVLKKYSKVDFSKFNFLKNQDYFTSPVQYDKINIHFPFDYDFDGYIGILFQVYAYDFENKNIVYFSNYFYDKTDINIEKLMKLNTPFRYGEKEWGKYLELSIPSIDDVSNNRLISSGVNRPVSNSINYNITSNNIGVNLLSPIFIDFSFIITRETVLSNTYYYLGDTFSSSISKSPEYESLGVSISESDTWDFFEIYGFYNDSNENLDNFVRELEEGGRKINIEYVVTLYEENIQSGFPVRFLVTENFSQKIEYRPIFKYSNTTASINVEMLIEDLVDNTTITRTTSLGITKNLFKYGKKLSKLNISTINKPKIYNYRSDNIMKTNSNISSTTSYGITKVPYPLLVDNYKIFLNSSKSQSDQSEYKSLGTLTLLLTPFDNIIKFKIARQINSDGSPENYDMSEILSNATLTLIFKSDTETIEKGIFYESSDNNIQYGVIVFKVTQLDMKTIKTLKETDDNFYITLVSNNNTNKTLLYSGKYKIYEDVKFLDDDTTSYLLPENNSTSQKLRTPLTSYVGNNNNRSTDTDSTTTTNQFYLNDKIENDNSFYEENLPTRPTSNQNDLDYYRNIIIYMTNSITETEKVFIKTQLESLGLSVYYGYDDTYVLERVHVSKISNIENISYIENVIPLKLNFGWGNVLPPTPISPTPSGENPDSNASSE